MGFYVRKFKNSWALYLENYENGIRSQRAVAKSSYTAIGIREDLNLEQAKVRAKELNAEQARSKKVIAMAAIRAKDLGAFDGLYFKDEDLKDFCVRLRIRTAGSDRHLLKLFSHFEFVKTMTKALKLLPNEYNEKSEYIFRYMAESRISLDYAKKIIQMCNIWGGFVSRRQGRFYEPIGSPSRSFQTLIAKAQRGRKGVRRASRRLTLKDLDKLRLALPVEQYNWVRLSLWFGLRPSEVDGLKDSCEIITNSSGVNVLKVLQTKIESSNIDNAYKYIPILFSEQIEALDCVNKIIRPSANSLKHIISGLDTYGGRKGFADLMQSRGQKIEHISLWLGHKSLKTTLAAYKDLSNVPFTPVNKMTG